VEKIAGSKPKSPATPIHLDQHQSLWAATDTLDSPVHIATHERIRRGMSFDTLADCEVVGGVVGGGAIR
jgi:hypothetical protein